MLVKKNMTHYNFIDIGTADFDYTKPSGGQRGIYIDPIKSYLDAIPNDHNILKLNVAITNQKEIAKIYYLTKDFIKQNKLPWYLSGCNQMHKIHPTIIRECKKKKIDYISNIQTQYVQCLTVVDLITEYSIQHIDFLKIDTEGSDCDIVNQVLDLIESKTLSVDKILFETNQLTTQDKLDKLIQRMQNSWDIIPNFTRWNTLVTYKGNL